MPTFTFTVHEYAEAGRPELVTDTFEDSIDLDDWTQFWPAVFARYPQDRFSVMPDPFQLGPDRDDG